MKTIKRFFLIVLSLVVLAGIYFIYGLYINPKSPKGSAEYVNGNTEIQINYYRPYKKDRLIFGALEDDALVPYGQYWRLGANLTTQLKTNKELFLADRKLAPGSYGMYVYPYSDYWQLIIHEKDGGLSASEPDSSGVLMQINLPVDTLSETLEQFTIDFLDQNLRIRWDTTQVLIPFKE